MHVQSVDQVLPNLFLRPQKHVYGLYANVSLWITAQKKENQETIITKVIDTSHFISPAML